MSILPTAENPMLLFGCGNMGRAMLDGWLAAGFDPAAFAVVDPNSFALPAGVAQHHDVKQLVRSFDLALLAIKPQLFSELAGEVEQALSSDARVLSILAGTRIEKLQALLPGRSIVRVMPNLAAALGKSPIGLFSTGTIDRTEIGALFAPLGSSYWLDAEEQMDAVTALAGSGPAFVYRFIDALAKAGARLGLDEQQSRALAKAMVEGASALASASDDDPEVLARKVTSPGGTTAAGLAVLDEGRALERLIEATLTAARDRGIELSRG